MELARLNVWRWLRTDRKAGGESGRVDWRLLGQLFWSFFKIGPVTFGGGYAMIPLIEREVVERRKWVSEKDVADVFAVSESIPGAIAINSATFVGYRIAGWRGAMAAMIGVLLPTFLIVLGLCVTFLQVQDHPKVEAAFKGIRAAIVALIVFAGIKIGKTAVFDKTTLGVSVVTVGLLLFLHMHPILIIALGGAAGIALVRVKQKMGYAVKLERHEEQAVTGQSETVQRRYVYADYYFGDGI